MLQRAATDASYYKRTTDVAIGRPVPNGSATDGLKEGPGLVNAFARWRLTPVAGADGSSQEFDVAVGHSTTSCKVLRRKFLDESARRDNFSFLARHSQPDDAEMI